MQFITSLRQSELAQFSFLFFTLKKKLQQQRKSNFIFTETLSTRSLSKRFERERESNFVVVDEIIFEKMTSTRQRPFPIGAKMSAGIVKPQFRRRELTPRNRRSTFVFVVVVVAFISEN